MITKCAGGRKNFERAMRSRAWVNGVEVTDRCFYADPRRGVVRCFKLGTTGKYYMSETLKDSIATEELRGQVRVRTV